MSQGDCLIARIVALQPNSASIEKKMVESMQKLSMDEKTAKTTPQKNSESYSSGFSSAASTNSTNHSTGSLKKNSSSTSEKHRKSRSEYTKPSEFMQMQRMRTNALSHREQTTSHFGGTNPDLLNDLLRIGSLRLDDEQSPPEKKESECEEKENQKEEKEDDLVERGPISIRGSRVQPPHPYSNDSQPGVRFQGQQVGYYRTPLVQPNNYPEYNSQQFTYSTVGVQEEKDGYVDTQVVPSAFVDLYCESFSPQQGYNQPLHGDPCLAAAQSFSPCSGRDDLTPPCAMAGYQVESPSDTAQQPFADGLVSREEIQRLLEPQQLPDALSDFILKYSRRYSTDNPPSALPLSPESRSASRKSSSSDSSHSSVSSSPNHRPGRPLSIGEDGSFCDSPLSAGSAPQSSPAAPRGAATPNTPSAVKLNSKLGRYKHILPKQGSPAAGRSNQARDRLRSLIPDTENDKAWMWVVKCIHSCPGALYYRDPDGDSLLHICVWHRDTAKIFALVELMLKTEYSPCQKPFDMPNRLHETPLFLAVEKRMEEVVSYLLECGANPNFQTRKTEADAPLHYAAARGMTEVVHTLCNFQGTDKNLRNGLGMTPLLCAVKNHGVIEEESQCLVNNKPTIRALLKAGADPKIPDSRNGKTVLHHSVERMDPELIEIYRHILDKEAMRQLVNISCYGGETPIELLQRMASSQRIGAGVEPGRSDAEEELKRKMFQTLRECGATFPMTTTEVDPLE